MRSFCDNLGLKLANNPNFITFKMETFGIGEARELRILATRKAIVHKKIFFISSAHLTLEAQNALLKIFEDPSLDTYFFLVAREEALIIPTLRSRMQISRLSPNYQGSTLTQEAEKFLLLSIKERLLFAKKFTDEDMNLSSFLDSILLLLKKQGKTRTLIENVYNLRRFTDDPATLPRLVIEHLSLVLQ